MLEQVRGFECPLLHHPLVRRTSGGLPESPNEMSGRHAASVAKFVDGWLEDHRFGRNSIFFGDALLP
jgi:hypothetical protein